MLAAAVWASDMSDCGCGIHDCKANRISTEKIFTEYCSYMYLPVLVQQAEQVHDRYKFFFKHLLWLKRERETVITAST